MGNEPIVVRHLESDDEARACARIMAESEPWITLRRDYDASLALVRDPLRVVYVVSGKSELLMRKSVGPRWRPKN